jgi:hypothetical protein
MSIRRKQLRRHGVDVLKDDHLRPVVFGPLIIIVVTAPCSAFKVQQLILLLLLLRFLIRR